MKTKCSFNPSTKFSADTSPLRFFHKLIDENLNEVQRCGKRTGKNRCEIILDKEKNTSKDQIISWSTTYGDLLSTHEPFSESIPLPEMVDFLVDIWYDEGLYD